MTAPGPLGPPHVVIIDDHELLSASLKAALEADGYRVTVPPLTDLGEVAEGLAGCAPEVALLDLDLGDFGRGEGLLPVLRDCGARVIVVSATADRAAAGRCLRSGARGWVPKNASFDELLSAISKEAFGEDSLAPAERVRLLDAWRNSQAAAEEALAPFERLTNREAAVLGMLMDGMTVDRIATESYVSAATVRTQVRAILMKMGVNSQLEAVAKAGRAGWKHPHR